MKVNLSKRAERDLRRLDPQVRGRIVEGLNELASGAPNLDIKVLKGHPPWCRFRIASYRVLFLVLRDQDLILVERIVSRGDLTKAVSTLVDVDE